jgi:hypothetical protein
MFVHFPINERCRAPFLTTSERLEHAAESGIGGTKPSTIGCCGIDKSQDLATRDHAALIV